MLHHHNWIRNEAIEYVQTILRNLTFILIIIDKLNINRNIWSF